MLCVSTIQLSTYADKHIAAYPWRFPKELPSSDDSQFNRHIASSCPAPVAAVQHKTEMQQIAADFQGHLRNIRALQNPRQSLDHDSDAIIRPSNGSTKII